MPETKTTVSLRRDKTTGESCYIIRHKSGLAIRLIPKKLSTAYAVLGVRYGARDTVFRAPGETDFRETPEGVAHFLEHKMFDMEDGTDVTALFAQIGAYANAYTSDDMTAYEVSCSERFDEALGLLLHYVTHPYFSEETVRKEQGIIAEEIRMERDNPNQRLYADLRALLFRNPENYREICGTEESIARITPEILYACYHAFYNLRNMALCVCGDITPDEIIAVADETLTAAEQFKTERYFKAEARTLPGKRHEAQASVGKTLFAVGIRDMDPPENTPEGARRRLALQILSELLFGVSGSFYNTLYEEGLLNGSYGGGYESTDGAAFYCLCGESDDPDAVYARLLEHCDKMRADGPDPADFTRIKKMLFADYVRTFNATDSVAGDMLEDVFTGVELFDVGRILSSVTYEEILPLFDTFFREENTVLTILHPKNTERTVS